MRCGKGLGQLNDTVLSPSLTILFRGPTDFPFNGWTKNEEFWCFRRFDVMCDAGRSTELSWIIILDTSILAFELGWQAVKRKIVREMYEQHPDYAGSTPDKMDPREKTPGRMFKLVCQMQLLSMRVESESLCQPCQKYIYIQICFLFCVCTIILIYTHTHLKECPRVLDPGCVPCCSRSKLGQQSFCKCGGPKNHRTKSAGWPNYLGTGCLVPTHDWGGCVNMYASAYQRRITPRWIEASSFFSSVASFLIAQSCVEVLKLPLLDRRVRRERPGARMLFLAQWGLRGRKISRSWQAEKKNEAHKRSQK